MKNTVRKAVFNAFLFSTLRIKRIVILVAALFFAQFYVSAQPFSGASVAKRGNGNYRGSIFWINWDLDDNSRPGDPIPSGTVRTVTTTQGITYTMTITKINGNNNNMSSYVPGQYAYDDLKTGYNWFNENVNTNGPTNTSDNWFGYAFSHNFFNGALTNVYDDATDAHNSVIGIVNVSQGQLVEFSITVTATFNGNPIVIPGMIATGAESLGSTTTSQTESETFTTNGDAWQAVERVQNNFQGTARATEFYTIANVTNEGKTVLDWNNVNDGSQVQGPGTMLWFSRGSNQVDVALKGGGNQAIAIGFIGVEDIDFGDAPVTYGNVIHGVDEIFEGGTPPIMNNVELATAPLAIQTAPISSLGQLVDIETIQFYSADLLGDDISTATNDEDAIPNPYSSTVVYGSNSLALTIPVRNNNTFEMQVLGWVDINLDGVFQANERSAFATVAAGYSGTVNVNFSNLPSTFQAFKKYPLRLRMVQAGGLPADDPGTANVDESSFGFAVGGEVEDHFVKIPDTDLSGTIFLDQNENKLFDSGEGVYPNDTDMFVYIVDADGNVVAKDTAVNGAYTLSGVPTGVDLTSLGYKVIASSQNVAVGDPLTTGAVPSRYEITGEDLSQAGSNVVTGNSDTDFVLELTGTVSGPISNVNFGVFDPELPVNFGSITARMVNGVLKVDWTTLTEEGNAYFIIEASRDGKSFQEIGRVNSLAENGNSDKSIDYHFSLDRIQEMQMPIILIISMLLIGLALVKRRKIALFIVATVLVGAISCKKKDRLVDGGTGNYYIRIVQVDLNGSSTTSKAIKVINE